MTAGSFNLSELGTAQPQLVIFPFTIVLCLTSFTLSPQLSGFGTRSPGVQLFRKQKFAPSMKVTFSGVTNQPFCTLKNYDELKNDEEKSSKSKIKNEIKIRNDPKNEDTLKKRPKI